MFEYVGRTGMTIIGPVSGRRYRFDRPGARVPVDSRDRPSLAAIANLRQVGRGLVPQTARGQSGV
jgi:hypothetical protein